MQVGREWGEGVGACWACVHLRAPLPPLLLLLLSQACNRQSYHCAPLYDTLGENAIEYIINHSEPSSCLWRLRSCMAWQRP